MPSEVRLTATDAHQLAELLTQDTGPGSVGQRVLQLEARARIAARLIKALLRQTHSSDIFTLPAEGEG